MNFFVFLAVAIIASLVYKLTKIYLTQKHQQGIVDGQRHQQIDSSTLNALNSRSLELQQRIEALEHLLDHDLPGWRERRL